MKEVVLHIGFPKTGTTSIQGSCRIAQDDLKAQSTLYPVFDMTGMANQRTVHHLPILIALMETPPPRVAVDQAQSIILSAAMFDQFRASDFDRLLLSHETLSQRRDLDFQRLKEWTAGHRTHVVAYVRTYDEWIESLYVQNVKDPRIISRPFRHTRLSKLDTSRFLPRIGMFAKNLRNARVTVASFDRFRRGGLVENFLELCNVTQTPQIAERIKSRDSLNVRPPSCQTMLMAYATFGIGDNSLNDDIVAAFKAARRTGQEVPLKDRRFNFMPPDLKIEARESYRRDLPKLRRRFELEADDPGAVTAEALDYSTTLTRVEFDTLVEFVRPALSAEGADRLAGAYDRADAAMR